MITFRHKGNFSKTTNMLRKLRNSDYLRVLDRYGREGVAALASATPVDSGITAASWYYTIERTGGATRITFGNANVVDGVPIAIVLQYGHGTGTGGWVQGRDYINPAIQPIFDRLASDAWREVTKL